MRISAQPGAASQIRRPGAAPQLESPLIQQTSGQATYTPSGLEPPTAQTIDPYADRFPDTGQQIAEPAPENWYPHAQSPQQPVLEQPVPILPPHQTGQPSRDANQMAADHFELNFSDGAYPDPSAQQAGSQEAGQPGRNDPSVNLNGNILNPRPKMASERALELLAQNAALQEELDRRQAELNDKTLQIRGLMEQLRTTQDKANGLQEKVFSLESDNDQLRAKLRVAKLENQELKRETDETLSKIEANLNSVLLRTMSEGVPSNPGR